MQKCSKVLFSTWGHKADQAAVGVFESHVYSKVAAVQSHQATFWSHKVNKNFPGLDFVDTHTHLTLKFPFIGHDWRLGWCLHAFFHCRKQNIWLVLGDLDNKETAGNVILHLRHVEVTQRNQLDHRRRIRKQHRGAISCLTWTLRCTWLTFNLPSASAGIWNNIIQVKFHPF